MALSGPAMLLKSMGIDPEAIMKDFVSLTEGVKSTLAEINARLDRIEKNQEEEKQWRMNNGRQTPPALPLALQPMPQQPPMMQPEKQL